MVKLNRFLLACLVLFLASAAAPLPQDEEPQVSAFDLILAINSARTANGLPALIEDPILDSTAQYTAQVMAQNQMSWHIGDVSGRVMAAGYGGGAKAWATENFMVGPVSMSEIMSAWADPDHMIPMVNPAYCHIGAGVADVNGRTYYVVQAAYTSTKACGPYVPGGGGVTPGAPIVMPTMDATRIMAQVIQSVEVSAPGPDGKIYHEVRQGQSLWSISVAYKVKILELVTWNGISQSTPLRIGQKLLIPQPGQATATLTPSPTMALATARPDGKIFHEIRPGQTLWTIAELYKVKLDELTTWNGITVDTPLTVGIKLYIPVTLTPTSPATATPQPSQTPLPSSTPSATTAAVQPVSQVVSPTPTPTAPPAAPFNPANRTIWLVLGGIVLVGGGLVVFGVVFRR